MTASVHDLAEAVSGIDGKGDIPFGMTDEESEESEYQVLLSLAADPDFPLTLNQAQQAIEVMRDSKLKPEPETEEGRLFWLTERLGYFRTALIGFNQYKELLSTDKNEHLRERLLWMCSDILGNSYTLIATQLGRFKSLDLIFETNIDVFGEMLSLAEASEDKIHVLYGEASHGERGYDPDREIEKIRSSRMGHKILSAAYSDAA